MQQTLTFPPADVKTKADDYLIQFSHPSPLGERLPTADNVKAPFEGCQRRLLNRD